MQFLRKIIYLLRNGLTKDEVYTELGDIYILYKNTKSCRGTHSRKRRGRNYCCKGKHLFGLCKEFEEKCAR